MSTDPADSRWSALWGKPAPRATPTGTSVTYSGNDHPYAVAALNNEAAAIAAAPEGTRNYSLHRGACAVIEFINGGQLPESALDTIRAAARAAGLDDTEIENTIRSARDNTIQGGTRDIPELPSDDLDWINAVSAARVTAAAEPAAAAGEELQDGGAVADSWTDLTWVTHGDPPRADPPTIASRSDGIGLFYTGRVNGIFGDPETAKSWLAIAAAVEELNNGNRVMYLDADHNGATLIVERFLLLGARRDAIADPDRFRYIEPDDKTDLAHAIGQGIEWAPILAIVDSIGEILPMLGLKSNDNDDITVAHRWITKPLANAGACVIGIDHLPKGDDSRGSGYAIGGTAKKRAIDGSYLRADIIGTAIPAPGRTGRIRLTINKDRPGLLRAAAKDGKDAGVFVLDSSRTGRTIATIQSDADPFRPTHYMELASRALEEHGSLNTADLRALVKERNGGLKPETLVAAVDFLDREAFIVVNRRKGAETIHKTLRAYRENTDPKSDKYEVTWP